MERSGSTRSCCTKSGMVRSFRSSFFIRSYQLNWRSLTASRLWRHAPSSLKLRWTAKERSTFAEFQWTEKEAQGFFFTNQLFLETSFLYRTLFYFVDTIPCSSPAEAGQARAPF